MSTPQTTPPRASFIVGGSHTAPAEVSEPPADYAKDGSDGINNNSAPVAQAVVKFIERTPSWVYLLISVVALVFAVALWLDVRRMTDDFDDVRRMIESSQGAAINAVRDAAVAAERADKAERSAALNREYAVQVVGQLNRMGYPVISPGENDHPPALPADYEQLDTFIAGKEQP